MIFLPIKFALAFVISFVILSIPIGDQTVFNRLHSAVMPLSKELGKQLGQAKEVAKDASRKVYSGLRETKINRKDSAPERKKGPEEDLSESDRKRLSRLLQSL